MFNIDWVKFKKPNVFIIIIYWPKELNYISNILNVSYK